MSDLAPQGDTPTLAEVREKIEARYATALGQNELAGERRRGADARGAQGHHRSAATSRLDAIRASMAASCRRAARRRWRRRPIQAAIEAGRRRGAGGPVDQCPGQQDATAA